MKLIFIVPTAPSDDLPAAAQSLITALKQQNQDVVGFPALDATEVAKALTNQTFDEYLVECYTKTQNFNSHQFLVMTGLPIENAYAVPCNQRLAQAFNACVLGVVTAPSDNINIIANLRNYPGVYGIITNRSLESNLPEIMCAGKLNFAALAAWGNNSAQQKITPTIFQYQLFQKARSARKRIVLPEGSEPRTLQAAQQCTELGLATCVLLGERAEILDAAQKINLTLDERIEIVNPQQNIEHYADVLCELRKSKGLTREDALKQLQSNTVVGTMMLHLGEVDGLVSGAIHTTADTIRPALQIIKTRPGAHLVSSVFFMCLPEGVLLYGDCAVNPNPTAEALAEIALQSSATAAAFGIEPRTALLSYSTINSGSGPDVDKVKAAAQLLKTEHPELTIEGPLQYDAAVDPEVAAIKAPQNAVAGRANVFIFPDLEAGNIGYKAVQRNTHSISMGPVLQGLRKPVNDLSRGASVKDIVYTIVLTAIQASA